MFNLYMLIMGSEQIFAHAAIHCLYSSAVLKFSISGSLTLPKGSLGEPQRVVQHPTQHKAQHWMRGMRRRTANGGETDEQTGQGADASHLWFAYGGLKGFQGAQGLQPAQIEKTWLIQMSWYLLLGSKPSCIPKFIIPLPLDGYYERQINLCRNILIETPL